MSLIKAMIATSTIQAYKDTAKKGEERKKNDSNFSLPSIVVDMQNISFTCLGLQLGNFSAFLAHYRGFQGYVLVGLML